MRVFLSKHAQNVFLSYKSDINFAIVLEGNSISKQNYVSCLNILSNSKEKKKERLIAEYIWYLNKLSKILIVEIFLQFYIIFNG